MTVSRYLLRLLPVLALVACAAEPSADDSPNAARRGGETRAAYTPGEELYGSCEGACGSKSDGSCWCDEVCARLGDCCTDYQATCSPAGADRAYFYGNAGTWGWLGLDDSARMLRTPEAVSERFGELCDEVRAVHPDGDDLPCHADLIAVTPSGNVSKTEAVAERILADHDATISFDLRPHGSLDYWQIRRLVERIFRGETSIVSEELLREQVVGLSLDFEPRVVGPGDRPSADQVNATCSAYRDVMISYGHEPDSLSCFLYEFGSPTMVRDGENLDPWIFPILMTTADRPRVLSELSSRDTPATPDNILDVALELKELWIDNVDLEYSRADTNGCMLFTAPYLRSSQRDAFELGDALEAFDDKCDIWSFQ